MNGPVVLRHLPTLVTGYRYEGDNAASILTWAEALGQLGAVRIVEGELVIRTNNGWHDVEVGETVLHGTQGELYQIEPAVRAACYEELTDDDLAPEDTP